jgi:hypothetical protein
MRRTRQIGAALVEFQIVALLALLPVILGTVQMAMLLSGFHVLSFAASEAARAGSIAHGDVSGMRNALAEGLTPLATDLTEVNDSGGPPERIVAGRLRAEREVVQFASIERTVPTSVDFADHGTSRGGRRVIPNDALEHRSKAAGSRSGRSIQQSNLLRIRVRYCHSLVVPLIDRMLPPLLQLLDNDPRHHHCYLAGRVPLQVLSSAPMQSDAWQ